MRCSTTCRDNIGRCHTPLIEICDTTSQIKLDLASCGACATEVTGLLIQKAGCTEWIIECEPPEEYRTVCCGNMVVRMPSNHYTKRAIEKPKPAVLYSIHEIDNDGMSVFVLDGKLKELGYGRYTAILVTDDGPTDVVFNINYIKGRVGISSIAVETLQTNLGDC